MVIKNGYHKRKKKLPISERVRVDIPSDEKLLKENAERIKKFRKDNGLSQNDLAILLDVTPRTVINAEKTGALCATAFLKLLFLKSEIENGEISFTLI